MISTKFSLKSLLHFEIETRYLFGFVEDVGKVALSAVLTVVHGSHEDTGTTLFQNISFCNRSRRLKQ